MEKFVCGAVAVFDFGAVGFWKSRQTQIPAAMMMAAKTQMNLPRDFFLRAGR